VASSDTLVTVRRNGDGSRRAGSATPLRQRRPRRRRRSTPGPRRQRALLDEPPLHQVGERQVERLHPEALAVSA